ncbi:MAG TPA: acyltransferase [Plantibacter sp.]|uniref:acyltransferase family protein n=1 Tax=Plantibacter sp. TaxID=1871045 RepID=UPI002C5D2703|nr:acyltransferase [Plantibacter sp.]
MSSQSSRLRSLDGVRGMASVVVVLYHVSLLARPFATGRISEPAWDIATETPLKLLFAGTEAVQVFFVLSGLVVALPLLRGGASWPGFFAARFVRLYLPVWGALLLASALILLVPRDPSSVSSGEWIANANATSVDPVKLLREATLTPVSYDLVNTLWSLRWELIFTLLLPLAVVLAVLLRRWALPLAALMAVIMVLGRVAGSDAAVYLPAFFIGTLIAVRLEDLQAWASARPRRLQWSVLTAVSALLLVASWISRPVVESSSTAGQALWGLSGVGAAGLIVVAIGSPLARQILEVRPVLWLGRVSFSLYLVHAPILATLAFAFGDEHWWLVGIVGIPLSLLVAAGFFAVVEHPSHGLARRVGRAVQSLVEWVRARVVSRRVRRGPAGSSGELPSAAREPNDG